MFLTITGVVIAILIAYFLMWMVRISELADVDALAYGAIAWTLIRWQLIHQEWWLIRPLGVWWVLPIVVVAVLLLLIDVTTSTAWLGMVIVAVAVLAPFGDLLSGSVWHWPTFGWVIVAMVFIFAVIVKMKWVAVLAFLAAVVIMIPVTVISSLSSTPQGEASASPTTSTSVSNTSVVSTSSSASSASTSASATSSAASSAITSTTRPTGTGTPSAGACPAGYAQKADPHTQNRFFSGGVKTSKEDLAYLGHDALALGFRAYAMKLASTPDPSKLLAPDGKCLSREGQDIYLQVKGALSASGTTVDENGQAPADGTNTGVSGGKAVVNATPIITGDRAAIIYTLQDGTKVIVLKRCGNLVFTETPPKEIPKGPTDNPPLPPPTSIPPASPPAVTTTPKHTPPPATTPLTPKDPKQGAATQGNVAAQVQGGNPPAAPKASPPKVSSPAPKQTYVAPATPATTPVTTRSTPATTSEPKPKGGTTSVDPCADPNNPACG